jgi:hypothetical protein
VALQTYVLTNCALIDGISDSISVASREQKFFALYNENKITGKCILNTNAISIM